MLCIDSQHRTPADALSHLRGVKMKKQKVSVPPVHDQKGRGSTNLMFDLYLDAESNVKLAFSPGRLHWTLRNAIRGVGMTQRKSLLDPWETKLTGPASFFHSLEESHVRIETWPEDMHVQGEVQLCNYSRNNTEATWRLAWFIIDTLNPARGQILPITRGPNAPLGTHSVIDWKRSDSKEIIRQLCTVMV